MTTVGAGTSQWKTSLNGAYKEAQATAEKALEGAPELLDFNELGYAPVESYPEMEGLPAQVFRHAVKSE